MTTLSVLKALSSMSAFEALSLVVASLALIISLLAWLGQRRLQREANALQRPMASLSVRQLKLIEQEEAEKARAKFSLSLIKDNLQHRLLFQNIGQAVATDVEIASIGESKNEMLLVQSDVDETFPLKHMGPGDQLRLLARVFPDSPPVFRMRVRWRNPDGELSEKVYPVGR